MKKIICYMFSVLLVLCLELSAQATPVTIDLAGSTGGSSVTVVDFANNATLTGTLADSLDSENFNLADGETRTVDFFTLTASGRAIIPSSYNISATLAFDQPDIDSVGTGSGYFFTIWGRVSGGSLTWDSSTLPDTFFVDGNLMSVDFEDGYILGLGNTTMVHAYITNNGESATPTPEPGTLLLLGAGLLGLGFCCRKQMES